MMMIVDGETCSLANFFVKFLDELPCLMTQGKMHAGHLMEEDLLRTKQCRLSMAKEEFFKAANAFILSKNSPLQPIFSKK